MTRQIAFLRTGAKAGKISDLSPLELEILRLLVAGRLKHKLSARSGIDLTRIALNVRT
jgi:hypothetical protein